MYKKSDNAAVYNFKKFMIKIQLSGDNWVQTKNPSKGVWRYGIIFYEKPGYLLIMIISLTWYGPVLISFAKWLAN